MNKFPETVRVGPIEFKVAKVDRTGEVNLGRLHDGRGLIELNKHMPHDVAVQVLWHEIIHVILHQTGMAGLISNEMDEPLVEAVSNGVAQVLMDNPIVRNL